MLAFCMGLTAIKYTFEGNLEMAVVMVLIACFMDGVDGSAARLLKSSSDFGAQLDSLADLMSFGVAPAIILYHWKLRFLGGAGWVVALVYASCTALRLARYNVESAGFSSDKTNPTPIKIKKNHYFHGIASPCAGILVLTPLISTFQILHKDFFNTFIICGYSLFISLMMVSRIPTLSTKVFKIEKNNIAFFMGVVAIITAAVFLMPWTFIPIMSVLYIISIPFTWFHYSKRPLFPRNQVEEVKE